MKRLVLALLAVTALAGCSGSISITSTDTSPSPAAPPAMTTAAAVVAKLTAAGLPVTVDMDYTAASDPNRLLGRQGGYTSKVAFGDARCTPDPKFHDISEGGSVEVFADPALAKLRYEYLVKIARSSPALGDGYDYLDGTIFLRLSSTLTPDQAAAYDKALRS